MPVRKRPLQPPQPETKLEPRLLTIPQVAAYLNTSVWGVREMLRRGMLKRVPIPGKKIVVDRVDVDALIDTLKAA